ncbi:19092_t:CDS:2, partial [Racocetra persica]
DASEASATPRKMLTPKSMTCPKPVSPQEKSLSDCGFVSASLYRAESQASLANAFDDLDVSSQNDSFA